MKSVRVPLAVILLGSAACRSVQPVMEPSQFIPQANPTLVIVTYKDNSEVPVAQPRVSGDTLLGTWQGLDEPVAVPLNQVQRIDALQRDRKRTTLFIAGLTAFTAAGVYALIQATTGGDNCDYGRPTEGEGGLPKPYQCVRNN